jgi:hypothetical protein
MERDSVGRQAVDKPAELRGPVMGSDDVRDTH